jgi:hypothetical protein
MTTFAYFDFEVRPHLDVPNASTAAVAPEAERAQEEDAADLAATSSTSANTTSNAKHGSLLLTNEFVYAYSVWTGGLRFLGPALIWLNNYKQTLPRNVVTLFL